MCLSFFSSPSGKYLLMLQSIKRALRVDPENGELHLNIIKFESEGRYSIDTTLTLGLSFVFNDLLNSIVVWSLCESYGMYSGKI